MANPTRIARYESPYRVVEWHRHPPAGTRCEPYRLETRDRALTTGWLYSRSREETVVCLMHPRADFSAHYAVPGLVDAGFAVFCQNSRWLGNDATLIHERILLDVSAGVESMRQCFDRVVLCGNSGGGSLYTFYLSEALAPEGDRLTKTATGHRLDLNAFDFPRADAMVYLAAHPGEGHFLLHAIDPSVIVEGDPTSCDPALDMFDPRNGFAEPPAESRYDPEFVRRYRAAQRARIERLDAIARERVERRRAARERLRGGGSPRQAREAIATEYLVIYRTEADPRSTDLSLDVSSRDYGSLFSRRPDLFNYGPVGFARVVTPDAWLSTWSGISSRAEISRTGPRMTLPAFMVTYNGDNCIFPSDADLIADSLGTPNLTRFEASGDHYGYPASTGRDPAIAAIVDWLRKTG
jgi:hypothetical protein